MKYLRPSDLFDHQRAWEEKRQQIDGSDWMKITKRRSEWTCIFCGACLFVDYDREPESCPTCGHVDLIPSESGW